MKFYVYVSNDPVNGVDPWGLMNPTVTKMLTAGAVSGSLGVVVGTPLTFFQIFTMASEIGLDMLHCTLMGSDIQGETKVCFYDCGDIGWTTMDVNKCGQCPNRVDFEHDVIEPGWFSGNRIDLIGKPVAAKY